MLPGQTNPPAFDRATSRHLEMQLHALMKSILSKLQQRCAFPEMGLKPTVHKWMLDGSVEIGKWVSGWHPLDAKNGSQTKCAGVDAQ